MTELTPPPTQESAFHGQSIPLVRAKPAHQALFPYFLVFLGTLLVVGIAGYWWMNSPMRTKRDAEKADALKAQITKEFEAEMLRRDQARQLQEQEEELAEQRAEHARVAERADLLLAKVDEIAAAMAESRDLRASLDHSTAGKEIAASGPLLAQYMRVGEEQARISYPAEAVRERVEPLADRSRKIAAGSSVATAPSEELIGKIAVDIEEADRTLRAQKQVNETVHAIIAQAEADDISAADVDLAKAMALLAERRKQEELEILTAAAAKGEALTKTQLTELAEQKAGELGAVRLEAAKKQHDLEIAAEKERRDAEIEALRQRHEEELRGEKERHEKELALLKQQQEEKNAQLEGEIRVSEAAADATKSEKELEAERIAAETEKSRLRAKAKTAEVASALAPFLGKGYWQPGRAQAENIDPVPVSLSAIQATGALNATPSGLHRLYMLGADPKNDHGARWPEKERGVGHGADAWLRNKPSAVATARKAQELLNELGTTLVELGMLAP
jgi:hypothetical protein